MASQLPMLSIPPKKTKEVDWIIPIRTCITGSYEENPAKYVDAYQSLQSCRQEAVQSLGEVDTEALYRLYKYFGQLELMELHFSNLKINFPWHDAFTNTLTTQGAVTYEKASILLQIASTNSALGASRSRSSAKEFSRAFSYFRKCAGVLDYLKENFLYAPSLDLSSAVLTFLVDISLAQATEVFLEKCINTKKDANLVAKIGSQATSMYTVLSEDIKKFEGNGVFNQNWSSLLQIKAKHFDSLSQFYQGVWNGAVLRTLTQWKQCNAYSVADNAENKYQQALTRFTQAEAQATNAYREASNLSSALAQNMSAAMMLSLQEQTKLHLDICNDNKNQAKQENKNNRIHVDFLPALRTLPVISKTVVATPIQIHEIFGAADVRKAMGPDLFAGLVPRSVRESARVYSGKKTKLANEETDKVEGAERRMRDTLHRINVKEGLVRYSAMAEGGLVGKEGMPLEVLQWREDIALVKIAIALTPF